MLVVIHFASGETHHYKPSSQHKLKKVKAKPCVEADKSVADQQRGEGIGLTSKADLATIGEEEHPSIAQGSNSKADLAAIAEEEHQNNAHGSNAEELSSHEDRKNEKQTG